MLRYSVLLLALALLALGALNVVKSPAWSPWQLGVLAGEFGHWIAFLAFALVVTGLALRQGSMVGPLAAIVASVAGVLLLKPALEAWRIAGTLPAAMRATFPAAELRAPVFSVSELFFGRAPEPVPIETVIVAPGLPMDFYRPGRSAALGPAPCVIVVHGGGWNSGDRTQLPSFNHLLARHGYAVAAVSYRLAPAFQWPAPADDLQAAIAYLKRRAPELGVDATRLVLLGRSAGGQIALTVGFTANDPAIRGVVGLYAPADLVFGYVNTHENDMLKSPALMRAYLGGTPATARANYESASAQYHVTPQVPPTLLIHGNNDALVWDRHSIRLTAKLADAHVPHVFVQLPWATHAFDFNLQGPGGQLTCATLLGFLAAVTR